MADTEIITVPEIYLHPGDVYVVRRPAILKTLLGSCIGITFWCSRLGMGALCHGVLPRCPPGTLSKEGFRYVDFAIRDLTRQFDNAGALRRDVEVKVFGGADVLPALSNRSQRATVGQLNSETAIKVLDEEQLNITASDIGGAVGRTIEFHTGSGEVLLRRLPRGIQDF